MSHRVTPRANEIVARASGVFPAAAGVTGRQPSALAPGGPFVAERGSGARLWDVDGFECLDFALASGRLPLGHAPRPVLDAIEAAVERGTSFGLPGEPEVILAERIVERMPHLELLRFVASEGEAAAAAVRAARAFTARDYLLKFDACYHGDADVFQARSGSGVATLGLPSALGVPAMAAALTLTAPFNDLDAARSLVHAHAAQLAAIIVEPVCAHGGFIAPAEVFLDGLRQLADDAGAVLVFDECATGLHVAPGGAQARFRTTPDLTILGSALGGGLPLALVGGRREVVDCLLPGGAAPHAAARPGSPLAIAAGIATLDALTPAVHARMAERTGRLVRDFAAMARHRDVPLTAAALGSMWGFAFRRTPVRSLAQARDADAALHRRFVQAALEAGVFLPPSPLEAAYLSAAHGDAELDAALGRLDGALAAVLR